MRISVPLRISLWAMALVPSLSAQSDARLSFSWFGDVKAVLQDTQDHSKGQLGQFVFQAHGNLGDHWHAFGEAVLEYNPDQKATGVDLERFYIEYLFDSNFSASLGKRHVPLGYWNNAFHHGTLFQPTISRPDLVNFEDGGGLQPSHDTGLWVTGRNLGPSRFGFEVMASNGQTGDQEQDRNNNKAITVHAETLVFDRLTLGASYRSDRLAAGADLNARPGTVLLDTDVTFTGADLRYFHPRFQFLAEYLRIKEKDLNGEATNKGWFAYVGVPLEAWTPYALMQDTKIDATTRLFAAFVESSKKATLGLKYDLGEGINAKAEWTQRKPETGRTDHAIVIALAFGF